MNKVPTILIRATLEEMRSCATAITAGRLVLYAHAWIIDPREPLKATVRGALFCYPRESSEGGPSDIPRCIDGHRPDKPTALQVVLATAPDGQIETWTLSDLTRQELFITIPAIEPWHPIEHVYHVPGQLPGTYHADYSAKEFPSADPRPQP